MRHYLLELAYDGAPFFGWQAQAHGNTVQDKLEAALAAALGHRVRLTGASRTDTGVHADQQFAAFSAPVALTGLDGLRCTWPAGVEARALRGLREFQHPGRHATHKRYVYRLRRRAPRDDRPFPRAWSTCRPLATAVLRAELAAVAGMHDFTAFCAGDSGARGKVRTLAPIEVAECGDDIELTFGGRGFLKQMIRIIVGSAVARATGQAGARGLDEILASRDRRLAGRCAPGQGLTLAAVRLEGMVYDL